MEKIFEKALGVENPWFIKTTTFDADKKRLDIQIDFQRGCRFPTTEDGVDTRA